MQIRYDARSFEPSWDYMMRNNTFECTWSELIWSALTVGRQNWKDVWISGDYSVFEAVYRIAMVYANLINDGISLKQSPAFIRLDPSEKSAVSYFIGLFCSKMFAEAYFDVPWLMHLDVYYDQLRPVLKGKSSPDLIGYSTSGKWIVIESKGRSNGFDAKAHKKARDQKTMIESVEGQEIAVSAAVQSYFSSGVLNLMIEDPEEKSANALDLPISKASFFEKYYKLIGDLLAYCMHEDRTETVEVAGQSFISTTLDDADLQVGLLEKIYRSRDYSSYADWLPLMLDMRLSPEDYNDELNFLGRDGVLVRCGKRWLKRSLDEILKPDRGHKIKSD